MDELTFNKELRPLNKDYYELFGVVPCMQGFDCTREEYVNALKEALETNKKIELLLRTVGTPADENAVY